MDRAFGSSHIRYSGGNTTIRLTTDAPLAYIDRESPFMLSRPISLVFGAVLAKEVARRVESVDYRALAAASVLGLGSIWAQGLSGSAALQMATPGALQPQIRDIVSHGGMVPGGIIGFTHTIFLWQSLVSVLVETIVVTELDDSHPVSLVGRC